METKYEWIHDLVKAEEQMEETGIIDFDEGLDQERNMIGAALTFLSLLRKEFNDSIEIFNELKIATASSVKIYGIAKSHADFMLFRNGYKLVFALKQPGVISVRTHFMNPSLPAVASMNFIGQSVTNNLTQPQFRGEEELFELNWGPFNETLWTFKKQPIKVESVVKHYLSKFIRDTTNLGL